MEKHSKRNLVMGYVLAALSVFFWGITFVCTKSLLNYFSPLEILFFRFIVAYLGLWLIRPKWEKVEKKDYIYFALAGFTGVTLYQYAENVAINFTTASNVSVIVSICPMFTAIIAQIFLKEKHITKWFVIGFIISIIGVGLVSLNGKTDISINPKGDLLALVASISWGFYSLFVSIINKKKYDSICNTRRVFFFAVIFMIPLVLIGMNMNEGSVAYFTAAEDINVLRFSKLMNWVNLLFLGLIASGFCFAAWNKACNEIGTVKASGGIYLIPVVTIIFAYFAIGEKITWLGIIGAILTITGLFLSGKK